MSAWTEDRISPEVAHTLAGLFVERVRRSPGRPAYRYYPREGGAWRELTWGEMGAEVARWRQALVAEGLRAGDRVAVLLRNCPEWAMFDQAALSLGLAVVPLYTEDRAENAAYIFEDAGVRLLLVQDAARWRRLASAVGNQPNPRRVILLESSDDSVRLLAEDPRVALASAWLPAEGPAYEPVGTDPTALATIVYTSGTTGRPKGVMLSHRSILEIANSGLAAIDCYQEDVFLSFLPLSHMLERTAGFYLPMMAGSSVAFARSVAQLSEDLQSVRPTLMVAVPRVFERVYHRLQDQVAKRPLPVRWLFRLAVRVGWRRFEVAQGRAPWSPSLLLWPLLAKRVATPVLERLGGRLRVAVSGGAALPKEVGHLFMGLGLSLCQGYGLTEAAPVVSVNHLGNNDPESVGLPLSGIEVRIGEGQELLVRGPGNMLGYWNNPTATAEVLDGEGWLHTGDVARIAQDRIYITGRIKDILVLSNGEKVSPGDMEMAILLDPLFEQAMVTGEGRSFLSALVVLSAERWPDLAKELGLDAADGAALTDPRLEKRLVQHVGRTLQGFPGYAKVRRLVVLTEPWTVENGMITPTLKVKRFEVLRRYQDRLEALYAGTGR